MNSSCWTFTLVFTETDTISHHDFIFSNSDGDFLMVRSTTTGHEGYIPNNYTAKVTHRYVLVTKMDLQLGTVCAVCERERREEREEKEETNKPEKYALVRRKAGSSLTRGRSLSVGELYLSLWNKPSVLSRDVTSASASCTFTPPPVGDVSVFVPVDFPNLKTTDKHPSMSYNLPQSDCVLHVCSLCSGGCTQVSADSKLWSCCCSPVTSMAPSWSERSESARG